MAYGRNVVAVIDTATNHVIATVRVGLAPIALAVTPNGKDVYVANHADPGTVSVIDTATNHVTATIDIESEPDAVAFTP